MASRRLAMAALLVTVAAPLRAQDAGLEERFRTLALSNAESYLKPVAEGLGYALTSGFVESGRTHSVLGFDIGVRVMGALPPASANTFLAIMPESVEYAGFTFNNPYVAQNGTGETPTAVGAGDGVVLTPFGMFRTALIAGGENPDDYNIQFPEGLDLPAVPFAVAQASIGLPLDTEVTLRFVPSVSPHEDIGDIAAQGFGVKHTITRWLPSSPIDVALFAGMQKFEVGDYLEASAHTYGAIASRSLGPLTLFGHVRSASADVTVSYQVENPDNNPGLPADGTRLGFDTKMPSGVRAGGGMTVRFIGIGLTGDYSSGPHHTVSVKAGVSIR